jgi:aspartate/methionine/tyrosine aminotransferase
MFSVNSTLIDDWYREKDPQYNISECGIVNVQESQWLRNIIINELDYRAFEYCNTDGVAELIDILTEIYSCNRSNVLITNGATEAIFLLLTTLTGGGNTVLYQQPYYHNLDDAISSWGGVPKHYSPCEKSFQFSPDEFNGLISEDVSLAVLNFPNNPTGCAIEDDDYRSIINFASNNKTRVIFDEVCSELHYKAESPFIERNICHLLDNCICVNSLSKAYGLSGFRVGWIIADDDTIARCSNAKEFTSLCTPPLFQRAAVSVLRKRQRILQMHRTLVINNLSRIKQLVERNNDYFRLIPPQGGACCFIELLNCDTATKFCENFYLKHGVLITPGEVFGYSTFFRLGLGVHENDFIIATSKLESFIIEYSNSIK